MKKILCLVTVILLMLTCCLAACNPKSDVADNSEFYDSITKTCKLTKSYVGKSFMDDGIGLAKVEAYTDGDTTRFKTVQGDTVIIRYHSIDTPESTGSVEKWGKSASNFVKSQLLKAEEIVLEATASTPEHDSYGQRYLGYVWYKAEGGTEFKLMNLEVVENGYSDNKGQDTSKYPYNEYFKKAEAFARSIELRLYSKLPDPLYSEDPEPTTIKELIEDLNSDNPRFYNAEFEAGSKVKVEAYLEDLTVTSTYMFRAVQYDRETGKSYSFNVYAQYSSANESKMKVGHLYSITGTVDVYNGVYQLKGITYSTRYDRVGYTKVIQRNYYNIFDSNKSFIDNFSQVLYTDATVVSSSVADGVLTINATAQLRTRDGVKDEVETFTFKVPVAADYVNEFDAGVTFSVSGYQFTADSGIIDIPNYNTISIK